MPELLTAIAVALVAAAAGMAMLAIAVRTQPKATERAAQIEQGRWLIERVSQELRQGEKLLSASSSGLEVLTFVNGETCGGIRTPSAMPCRVIYSCSATACSRTERNPDGTGSTPSQQVVEGIMGPDVFSYSPAASTDPDYVSVSLRFPGEGGGEAVTLQDGVSLRNHIPGAGG